MDSGFDPIIARRHYASQKSKLTQLMEGISQYPEVADIVSPARHEMEDAERKASRGDYEKGISDLEMAYTTLHSAITWLQKKGIQ